MATSADTVPCSICTVKNKTNVSKSWCPECEDALCHGCDEHHSISKATRSHLTIPIDDYMQLPSFILGVQLFCDEHNEKFHHYCKNHESPLCKKCITTTHKSCGDISILDDVMSNIKASYTLEDIHNQSDDVYRKIKEIEKDRKNNYDKIKQQKSKIIKEISDVRRKINQHLDEIEKVCLEKLNAETEKYCRTTDDLIAKLTEKGKQVRQLQEDIGKIKKYASDFQIIIGVKQIEKHIHTDKAYIKSLGNDGSLNQVQLVFDINSKVRDLTEEITYFGKINMETSKSGFDVTTALKNQAQFHVTARTPVNEKRLRLLRTFDRESDIGCCCIMDNGTIAVKEIMHGKESIAILRENGTSSYEISIGGFPVDMTIVDGEVLAVSCCWKITLINTRYGNIVRTITVGERIWGITYKDGCLIYCEGGKGVGRIELKTSKKKILLKEDLQTPSYITSFGGQNTKFALSEREYKMVRVFDSNMKELWRVNQTTWLKNPWYIFADRKYFLYVLDMESHSVVCISPDGKDHSVLKCDQRTFAAKRISFNDTLGQLLVCTTEHQVLVFDV